MPVCFLITCSGHGATKPKHYELKVVLYQDEKPIDDLNDRVGFRTIEVEGKKSKLMLIQYGR